TERQQMAADLAASKADVPELASRAAHRTHSDTPGAAAHQVHTPRPVSAGSAPDSAGPTPPSPKTAPPGAPTGATALLGVTRQIAADQHRLTLRDQRIAARRRLADIYGQWQSLVGAEERAVLHGCLQSATIVLAALL